MNSLYDIIVFLMVWILVLGLLIGFFSTFWWLILMMGVVGGIGVIASKVGKK